MVRMAIAVDISSLITAPPEKNKLAKLGEDTQVRFGSKKFGPN